MSETERHRGILGAMWAGIVDRGQGGSIDVSTPDRLDGKVVLVTGASRGLGRAIALGLAARGAHVHVAVRSLADETVAALLAAGAPTATAWPLDLERLASVDALADALATRGVRLDRLVLNAGVVPLGSRLTPDGLDVMMQVNAISNVRLVDQLLATGVLAPAEPAPRIVVVGSESHRSSPPIDWSALGTPRTYGTGAVVFEYGRTKLVLHTWAAALARRLDGEGEHVAVHHLCPGAIASDIAREAPSWSKPLLNLVFRLFFQSPEVASRPVLWLTAAANPGARTAVYLHMRKRTSVAAIAADPEQGAAAWAATHGVIDTILGA